jgi:dolichol-phosphate mannosyltransferase
VSSTGQRTLIALATYDERDNLEALLAAVRDRAPQADLLVIDDNSPDGTGRLADEIARGNAWLSVIHRPGKLGLGTAILAAMRHAISHDYDLLVTMDADFSHHPRYLPALLAGMDRKDVMIGSRYVPGGGYIGWPLGRVVMSRGVNLLVRVLMRLPARDCSGGYRCYRVDLLRRAHLERVRSTGYSFEEEVLYRCRKAAARIGETPIVFENRKEGASKLSAFETARSLAVLVSLGVSAFFGLD